MLNIVLEFMVLMLWDALFIGLYVLALMPLAIRKRAAYAVLKRNFLAYFANPTGYVFLCLFVLLTSLAAFWPHEFFQSNLANMDELNRYLPLLMLVFIPAITMSVLPLIILFVILPLVVASIILPSIIRKIRATPPAEAIF